LFHIPSHPFTGVYSGEVEKLRLFRKIAFTFSLICAIIFSEQKFREAIGMPRTSDKAQRILEYVNEFVQENGYAPSVREIGAAVGLRSTASVSYHIQALQEKGLLITPDGKGRKRSIVTNVRPGQIPVIGVVTAGVPILAYENQEGTMAWDGDPGCFALRVRGDSMVGAGILSGDKVVVRPQQSANDGQIVVARIGDEATVKRLRQRNGQVWLMPENDAYEPIDGSEAEIIGLVKAVVREY
jgi:repressor LexA